MKREFYAPGSLTIDQVEAWATRYYPSHMLTWARVICSCGESHGLRIYDNNSGELVATVALCDACYEAASGMERVAL